MVDAGGPGSVQKCAGLSLADLPGTQGFGQDGEENQLYAFQLSDGVYKRRAVSLDALGTLGLGDLSDVDVSNAIPRRVHDLAFTGSQWVLFVNPIRRIGWYMDIRVASTYILTGKQHKIRKVMNSGTRLCSYVPETKNIIVSEDYALRVNNNRRGALKLIAEYPKRIIGPTLAVATILIELIIGDQTPGFLDVLPGLKIKWSAKDANKELLIRVVVGRNRSEVSFSLEGIEVEANYPTLDISRIYISPSVSLKRLRLTPGDLTPSQTAAITEL